MKITDVKTYAVRGRHWPRFPCESFQWCLKELYILANPVPKHVGLPN